MRNSPPVVLALLNWWRTCSNGSAAQVCLIPYGSSVVQTPSILHTPHESATQDEGYITKRVYIATFMKVYRGVANDFVEEEARTRRLTLE